MASARKAKIVLIGAASASFGMGTIADVLSHPALARHDVTLALVDTDAAALDKTARLAAMVRAYRKSPVRVEATTDRCEALPGADFVITAVTRNRMPLWEQDFRVPLAFGFRHCLGENGGPGALFHALRNYEVILPICRDVERLCPGALVLNFTNPESRILMAMCHLAKVRAAGLCHGVLMARADAARWLGRDLADLDIVTGGLNHFFWILKIADRRTGEDLYPALRDRAREHAPPLVRKLTEIYDLLVFPSDDHVGEYLSFATEFTGVRWPYGQEHRPVSPAPEAPADWRDAYLSGEKPADERLARPGGEIVVDVIADILDDTGAWRPTVNVLNSGGYVENLPREAVVEVPAVVDAAGIHPQPVGPLPEALAAFCRTQVSIQLLLVEAYRRRSRRLLLQALLLDPCVDSVRRAEEMLDTMLELQKDYLPQFA
ncbi:MAG: alpha-glucosidase/alpha-galactosidase [Planctomycetes bacterium]|nr:alpha-glucosidase/alpha-galactosidase [Planctomycetota bacterium]